MKELASIPLLLTLMCITYEEDNDFPNNRAELYERAIDALLTKWDASRRIRRENPYKQLSTKRKKDLFAEIAFKTFKNDQYFIRERDLAKLTENFIVNMPGFKEKDLEFESKEVLKGIEAHHGIFIERARGIHSFGHLTFQEYFTAKYIVDHASTGSLNDLVQNHLYDSKWKEVFLLVISMLPNADGVLELMVKKNRELLHKKALNQLLLDLQKILLPKENPYPAVYRKAVGLYLIANFAQARAQARALDLARALDIAREQYTDRALALVRARDLARDLARDRDQYRDQYRDLDLGLYLDLYLDLDLDLDLDLMSFLSGNILITACLATDCYVSNQVRERIIDTMLDPLSQEG